MRRLRKFPVWSLLWLLVCSLWWWNRVPLVAETVIPWGGHEFQGETSDGEIILVPEHQLKYGEGFRHRRSGPIQIWNSRTGHLERTLLANEDTFRALSPRGGFVCVERDQVVRIVDLKTGEAQFDQPIQKGPASVAFSEDDQLVAIAFDGRVAVFDLIGREIWSRNIPNLPVENSLSPRKYSFIDELEVLRFSGPLLVVDLTSSAEFPWSTRTPPRDRLWLNRQTGDPDERFAGAFEVLLSGDQRLAIVTDKSGVQSIYGLEESRNLWQIPIPSGKRWTQNNKAPAQFNADSTEVMISHLQVGHPILARWRARDGQPITTPGDVPDEYQTPAVISPDQRYVVTHQWRERWKVPYQVRFFAQLVGGNADGAFGTPGQTVELTDTQGIFGSTAMCSRNFTSFGMLRTWWGNVWFTTLHRLRDPRRFAIVDDFHLSIFCFPPRRNWIWIIVWGLGPIGSVQGLRAWRSHRQDSKSQTAGVPNPDAHVSRIPE